MRGDRVLRCVFLLLVVGVVASLPLFAQKITGDISGTVQDATGAVVKDAKISATNVATGETRSAVTSEGGFYRILELPPGSYKVTAIAPGFKTSARDVQVALSMVTQSDFQLQPGQVSETIEVEGSSPLVETTEDRLSTLFEGKAVADLPNNGRDFNNLLDGVPGVQRSPGGGFQSLNINGQRATSNNFAVDGIPNNDRYYGEASLGQAAISGTAAALIPLEGISEFNVQSNPGVEFGVRGGSVVNIGIKSGTNDVHGSAFWDRHTDAFDAINPFGNAAFRLNQFGASGGGPIKKDKAFIFLSYQGFHLKDLFPATVNLPPQRKSNDAMQCVITGANPNTSATRLLHKRRRQGLDPIRFLVRQTTERSAPWARICFHSSPWPRSRRPGGIICQQTTLLALNNFHVKFDYVFSQSHRVSVKYLFGDSLQSQPPAPGVPQSVGPLATNSNMWNSVAPSRAQLAGVNYTWTITPTKVLESRFGYQRFASESGSTTTSIRKALGLNTGPARSRSGRQGEFRSANALRLFLRQHVHTASWGGTRISHHYST